MWFVEYKVITFIVSPVYTGMEIDLISLAALLLKQSCWVLGDGLCFLTSISETDPNGNDTQLRTKVIHIYLGA